MSKLEEKVDKINQEIAQINSKIASLQDRKNELKALKQSLIEQKIQQESNELIHSQNWESDADFPWSDKVKKVLKSGFKLAEFRPLQLSAINAVLR